MGYPLQQSNTTYPIIFKMKSAADGQTPVTGATVTVTLSKNGATYAAPAGTVSEIGNGAYKVATAAGDVNTLGILDLYATATGAAPVLEQYPVVAYNPWDAAALGLTRVDATVSSRATVSGLVGTAINNAPAAHTIEELLALLWASLGGTVSESGAAVSYLGTDKATTVMTQTFTPSISGATGRTTNK